MLKVVLAQLVNQQVLEITIQNMVFVDILDALEVHLQSWKENRIENRDMSNSWNQNKNKADKSA